MGLQIYLCLAVLAAITTYTCATILGPPPGSRGTIDFRYPNYIVDPLVACPEEGVFPHPRNCTWYYRCYDRYGLGFFWRAYFECEPGTVFSDYLDQCVFGSVNENCKPIVIGGGGGYPNSTTVPTPVCSKFIDDCSNSPVCPQTSPMTMYVYQVKVCNTAETRCSDGRATSICSTEQVYGEAMGDCIEKSSLCPKTIRPVAPVVCEDVVLGCIDYYVCPNVPTIPELIRRCNIQQICNRGVVEISRKSICTSGSFDAYQNTCSETLTVQYEGCDNSIPSRYPIPNQPICLTNSETCSLMPVCNSLDNALICKQFFSCDKTYSRVTRQNYFPTSPACIDVDPPTCEIITEQCTKSAFCTITTTSVFIPYSQVCLVAKKSCTNGTVSSICANDQVYDVQESICRQATDICTENVRPDAPIICEDIIDKCEDFSICPNVPAISEPVRMCDLTRVCKEGLSEISRTSVCETGQRFDAYDNVCVHTQDASSCNLTANIPSPSTPICITQTEQCLNQLICDSLTTALVCVKIFSCDIAPARKITVRSTFPVAIPRCMPMPQVPVTCEDDVVPKTCTPIGICPSIIDKTSFIYDVQQCPEAVKLCSDGSEKPACEAGFVYVKNSGSCVQESEFCVDAAPRPTKSIVCEDVIQGCNDIHSCPLESPDHMTVIRLCEIHKTCYKDGIVISKSSICPGGKYDVRMNYCVPNSAASDIQQCMAATPPWPPVCTMKTEQCNELPVCQVNETSLVCHHIYSCTPELFSIAVRQISHSHAIIDETCEEIPEVVVVDVTCQDPIVSECQIISLCPSELSYESSMFIPQVEVCKTANRPCSDGSFQLVCPPDKFYAPAEIDCLQFSQFCKVPQRPTSSIICYDEVDNCKDSYICPSNNLQPEVIRTCDIFRTCMNNDTGVQVSRDPICENGKYDAFLNQCVDDEIGPYECSPEAVTIPLPTLNCTIQHEICEEKPVCSTDITALMCRHLFSCSGSSQVPRKSVFKPRIESERDTQCMLIPSLVPPTCNVESTDCQYFATCPLDFMESQFVSTIRLCANADNVCSDNTRTPLCQQGEFYEDKSGKCIIKSSLCKAPEQRPNATIICEDEFLNCDDIFYCSSSTPDVPERVRRCDFYRTCTNGDETVLRTKVCEGKYDASMNQCVRDTPQAGEGCSSTAVIPVAPESPTCQWVTEECEQQPICKTDAATALVCKRLYYCLGDNIYYLRQNAPLPTPACVDVPVPDIDTPVPDTGTPPGGTSNIPQNLTITCSFTGQIPMDDDLKKFLCKNEAICSRDWKVQGIVTICEKYYRCQVEGNYLVPVEEACPDGEVLNSKTQTCVNLISDTTLPCTILFNTAGDSTSTTPATINPNSFSVTTNVTLDCNYDGETPIKYALRRQNCLNETLCHSVTKVYEGIQEKCNKHYLCTYDWDTSEFNLSEETCSSGQKFSYIDSTCYSPATNLCSTRSSQFFGKKK